jgi:hypothetical protein
MKNLTKTISSSFDNMPCKPLIVKTEAPDFCRI